MGNKSKNIKKTWETNKCLIVDETVLREAVDITVKKLGKKSRISIEATLIDDTNVSTDSIDDILKERNKNDEKIKNIELSGYSDSMSKRIRVSLGKRYFGDDISSSRRR